MKQAFVYFLTNWTGETLYIGVTSDLEKRIYQHKNGIFDGFSKRYNLNRLVYFEQFDDMLLAIEREKQIKNWRRSKKDELVKTLNPEWKDLSDEWYEDSSTRFRSFGMMKEA